jgi:antirestriction protein ArdC
MTYGRTYNRGNSDYTVQVDYSNLIQQAIKEPGTIAACYSLFHDYSLLNTMLVGMQQMKRFGQITPIKGFRAWNDLNRKVKKGEKALEVLFPVFGKFPKKDENGNEVKDENGKTVMIPYIKGFTPKHIHFAYSQTEIMDKSKEEKKANTVELKEFDYKRVCEQFGIKLIPYDMLDGNCQGYARVDKQELAINPAATQPIKTAVHEIAHCLMHKDSKLSRELKEVQAEGVTYIVCTMLGASEKTLQESRGYIQNWLKSNELDEKISKEIVNTANKILEAGVGKQKKDYKRD